MIIAIVSAGVPGLFVTLIVLVIIILVAITCTKRRKKNKSPTVEQAGDKEGTLKSTGTGESKRLSMFGLIKLL